MKMFFCREKAFKNLKNKAYCLQISWFGIDLMYIIKNKWLEIGAGLMSDRHYFYFRFNFLELINFDMKWSRKSDHAGFRLYLTISGLYFGASTYDTRHWDYENECWCKYE